ncbi:MAG TPA: tetratricopeptide repeat protein, partial [Bdellovibrionales bacterium]|nr:tetratricopeptide repeat protein [Bdellovibrionales bacterium]
MSARKAVTRILLLSLLSQLALKVEAQQERRSRKTVGDVLRRIEKNTKKVNLTKQKSALPAFKKQETAPVKSVNLYQVKPPSRSTLYYEQGTNEGELEKVTDQGIRQLYKLTQQFKNSKRRGELWLRLAELYVEKSRLIEYRLQQQFDDNMAKFQKGQTKARPKLDLKPSQDYNRKAVQLYEWFLRDFPKDPKVDQALFFLGYNFFELNQPEKGKDHYQRLTTQFPQSSYIEESNFALGEYYFEREQWAEALKHYQHVAGNKRARLYGFALYKTAWCQYKTGQVKQALATLERVIRSGRSAKSSQDNSAGGASRIRLASEAEKDLVVFYAEAGTPANARAYFEELAGQKATFALLEKLAYYYADIGNRDGARLIFRDLINEKPNSPKAYDYQYQIVMMFTSTDNKETFRAELFNWIQHYSPQSEWAQANKKDKELVARANQLIETTLRNHVLQNHQTAQNSRVASAQKAAKQGYELYFQTFKEGAKLDEMHFFYAELLFDMGEFETAAHHYGWIVEHAPNSQYAEKSMLNTVLALEKGLPKEEDLKKQIGDSLEAVQLAKNVTAFEQASERYVKAFPKGENVPAMRYKMGALYYYHNQFDKALESFNAIIRDYPKSPYAQYSANLTLDIYNLKKDYAGLEKAGQDILTNEALAKSQVGEQVKGVLQRASFKKAQDLEAKKDFAGAALAYEEFAKKNAGGELGTPASFNAAVNHERAGDLFKAIGMYQVVLADKSPKNDGLKQQASQFIAALYEKTGQYQKAAESFEAYAKKNPKAKESAAFYFNAAIIRDGMNAYNQATQDYQAHFDLTKGPDKWETLFLMAKLYERRGNITKAQDLYKQYYDARPRNSAGLIEAAYKVATIHMKKGRRSDAEDWYKKVIFQQKKLSTKEAPVGVSYAAEFKYYFVSKTYDELRAIKIPQDPSRQQAAVKQKLALLERLKEQLKEVIKYDDGPYIVNSLALIGQAYQHMAASIFAVPLPKGLDEEGLKQYKAGVEGVAKPFQDEAIKNYSSAIERGFALEGYSEGLKTAERELHRLSKDKFSDFGERAVITKLPDTLGAENDGDLGNAFKSKEESLLVEAASKKLGKDQNDLKSLNALAVYYSQSGKHGMARLLINRAIKAHANEPGLHNNLGVLHLNEGDQRGAIANFRKAMQLDSDYPIGAANLGSIFVEYKDYQRALDLLKDGYGAVRSDLRK